MSTGPNPTLIIVIQPFIDHSLIHIPKQADVGSTYQLGIGFGCKFFSHSILLPEPAIDRVWNVGTADARRYYSSDEAFLTVWVSQSFFA